MLSLLVLSKSLYTRHFCFVKFSDLYRKYFEHQAINHPVLQHDPTTRGRKIFAVIDIEESHGDFVGRVPDKGFVMRLINYTYQVGQQEHQATKSIQGGFMIARYYNESKNGKQDYFSALDASEKIVDEIIEKMIADSQNGHPLFDNYFDSEQYTNVQSINFEGDGTYAGWRCLFRTDQFWRNCLDSPDAPAWLDGGLTPFDL